MKYSIKGFFSKCDLIENFIFLPTSLLGGSKTLFLIFDDLYFHEIWAEFVALLLDFIVKNPNIVTVESYKRSWSTRS